MKKLLSAFVLLIVISSCNEPLTVTANPSSSSATSGTLGSVRASDGVRPLGLDSLPKKDSLK